MTKKPVLLWRDGDKLTSSPPDGFQKMPEAVSDQMVEALVAEGRTVLILTVCPERDWVTVELRTREEQGD